MKLGKLKKSLFVVVFASECFEKCLSVPSKVFDYQFFHVLFLYVVWVVIITSPFFPIQVVGADKVLQFEEDALT